MFYYRSGEHGFTASLFCAYYKLIQIDIILGKTITKKTVTTAVNKYYKGLQNAKMKEQNPLDKAADNLTEEEVRNFNSPSELAEAARIEEQFDEITRDHKYMTYARLREAVIMEIQNSSTGYNRSKIENAFGVIMAKENINEITLTNASIKTLAYLQSEKNDSAGVRKTRGERRSDALKAQEELALNDTAQKEQGGIFG